MQVLQLLWNLSHALNLCYGPLRHRYLPHAVHLDGLTGVGLGELQVVTGAGVCVVGVWNIFV